MVLAHSRIKPRVRLAIYIATDANLHAAIRSAWYFQAHQAGFMATQPYRLPKLKFVAQNAR